MNKTINTYLNFMLIPVILCGGSGSRLWPISRQHYPKPFIKTPSGESLLEKTFSRLKHLNIQECFIVTNEKIFFLTQQDIERVNTSPKIKNTYLLEPIAKNTAPAILMATLVIHGLKGKDVSLLVLPADHLIENTEGFAISVNEAFHLSQQGKLVSFGIQPTYPETGFGYIECGKQITEFSQEIIQFVEKPDILKAKQYLANGNYLWNSGMFCFRIKEILEAYQMYTSELYTLATRCYQQLMLGEKPDSIQFESENFASFPNISFDYAIMERATNCAVVNSSFDWNDIGSWSSMSELYPKDENNNRLSCKDYVFIDVKDSFVVSEDRFIGAIGIKNLVIVDTPDALLIANKNALQDVKHIYQALEKKQHPVFQEHQKEVYSWGNNTTLIQEPHQHIKTVELNPKTSTCFQVKPNCSEHWIILNGKAEILYEQQHTVLNTNQSILTEPEKIYQIINSENTSLKMLIIETKNSSHSSN